MRGHDAAALKACKRNDIGSDVFAYSQRARANDETLATCIARAAHDLVVCSGSDREISIVAPKLRTESCCVKTNYVKYTKAEKATSCAMLLLVLYICVLFACKATLSQHGQYLENNSNYLLHEVLTAQTSSSVMPDVRPQTYAYLITLAALGAAIATFAFRFADRQRSRSGLAIAAGWHRRIRRSSIALIVGLVGIWYFEVRRLPNELFDRISSASFDLALVAIIILPVVHRFRFGRLCLSILMVALLLFALAAASVGLVRPADISFWNYTTFTMVQFHFSAVLGAADRLGHGLHLWTDAIPYYGVLPSAVIGAFIKFVRPLQWSEYFKILQTTNLFMLAAVPVALAIHYRPRLTNIAVLVLPTCFVVPRLYTSFDLIWFPNQTAYRLLGLPVAILCLALLRKTALNRTALILGAVAAFDIACNLEIGVAATAGLIIFVVAGRQAGSLFGALCRFFAAAIVTFSLLCSIFRLLFDHWPTPSSIEQLRDLYSVLGNPWFGFELSDIDLIAPAIFVTAASFLILLAHRYRRGSVSADLRLQGSIAAIIVVWFSYYLKRPQSLNLWSEEYLFAFLLPGILDARRLHPSRTCVVSCPTAQALVPFLALALTLQRWSEMLPNIKHSVQANIPADAEKISGVWTRRYIAEGINAQVAALQHFAQDQHVIYASDNSFILPMLSGIYPELPAGSLFWGSVSQYEFRLLLSRIDRLSPDCVLVDDLRPDREPPFAEHNVLKFYERLGRSLSMHYHSGGAVYGWSVLSKTH